MRIDCQLQSVAQIIVINKGKVAKFGPPESPSANFSHGRLYHRQRGHPLAAMGG
jgi:hypothetical protein